MTVIVHVAGSMVDFVQRCARCGFVLCDYSKAAWPLGHRPPTGWTLGASIAVEDYGVGGTRKWKLNAPLFLTPSDDRLLPFCKAVP